MTRLVLLLPAIFFLSLVTARNDRGNRICYNYAYYPIDDTYTEEKTYCPGSFCVNYAVKLYIYGEKRLTFFTGNCDEASLCRPRQSGFNMTLSPEDFEKLFKEELPQRAEKINVVGKCCDTDECNKFLL